MEITRRNLFKLGAISALPACAKESALRPREQALPARGTETFAHSICGLCPAGCGIKVRKVDGRAVGVAGSLDHPINRGSLCPKGAAALQELYHPDRVRHPLLRAGPRGSGNWTEVAWEEAIAKLAEKVAAARQERKPWPLAAMARAHSADAAQDVLNRLARALGADNFFCVGSPASEPPADAFLAMHGNSRGRYDLTLPRLLVSFGFDWLQTHPSPVEAQRAFAQMRRKAGRERSHIVQIEPRFSTTAAKADQWIPVLPGAEAALALGLARQLVSTGNYDKDFVERETHGFGALKEGLEPYTLEKTSRATGVPEKEIRLLALKFSNLKPALAISSRGSPYQQMAVHSLNALLGNVGRGKTVTVSADAEDGEAAPLEKFGGAGYPQVLLLDRVNPIFQSPARWREVLEKVPFIVSVCSHFSETTEFSDLVLPCHAALEESHWSLRRTLEGRTVLNAAPGAVEPLHGTRDRGDIFLMLEASLNGGKAAEGGFAGYLRLKAKERAAEGLFDEGGDRRWLEAERTEGGGPAFTTRSRKFEFGGLTERMNQADARAPQSADADEKGGFPLHLYIYTPLAFSFGEGAHLPYLQGVAGFQMQEMWSTWAEVHPETASARGIKDGGMMWIESPKGKIQVKARLTASALPGVVSVPFGLGHTAYGRWAKGIGANPMEIADPAGAARVRIAGA